jgi:hypothetical protein
VTRERFVDATPAELERLCSPRSLVAWEGSFDPETVAETAEETVVTATGPGMSFRLQFEERPDGYRYEQVGDGPFDRMETRLTVSPENEGSRVTVRSTVSLGLPLPLVDRVAAWKRGGELDRLLDSLADAA